MLEIRKGESIKHADVRLAHLFSVLLLRSKRFFHNLDKRCSQASSFNIKAEIEKI